jgi:multidrug resistance efflux pump
MVINVKNDLLINKDIKGNQKLNTVRYTERIPVNIIITAKAAESTYTLQATSL